MNTKAEKPTGEERTNINKWNIINFNNMLINKFAAAQMRDLIA